MIILRFDAATDTWHASDRDRHFQIRGSIAYRAYSDYLARRLRGQELTVAGETPVLAPPSPPTLHEFLEILAEAEWGGSGMGVPAREDRA